jgi:hypothetical protein
MPAKNSQKILFCFFLLFGFELCLLLSMALAKDFWLDESFAFALIQKRGFLEIWQGMPREGSPTPLDYILQKVIITVFPPYWGNLQITLRIVPVFAFLLSLGILSAYVAKLYNSKWALAANAFYFCNFLLTYYAVESRAYSLWAALSLFHVLALHAFLRGNQKSLYYSLALAILLPLTASGGLLQVGGFSFIVAAVAWQNRNQAQRWRQIGLAAAGLILAFAVFLFYLTKIQQHWGFPPPTLGDYKTAIMSNFYSALRLPRFLVWLLLPILFLWWPWHERRRPEILGILAYGWILLLGTIPFYLLAIKNEFIVAARHYIYLQPVLSLLLLWALVELVKNKKARVILYVVVMLFSAQKLYDSVPFSPLVVPNFHRWPDDKKCQEFPDDPAAFNQMNRECSAAGAKNL